MHANSTFDCPILEQTNTFHSMLLSAAAYAILDNECNDHDELVKYLGNNGIFDDDDDDDDNKLLLSLLSEMSRRRRSKFIRNRIDFEEFAANLEAEGGEQFFSVFRMHRQSFQRLVRWLKPYLRIDKDQGNRSSCGKEVYQRKYIYTAYCGIWQVDHPTIFVLQSG